MLLKPELLTPKKGVKEKLRTGVGGHIPVLLGGDTSTTPPQVSPEPHPGLGLVLSGCTGGMELSSANQEGLL